MTDGTENHQAILGLIAKGVSGNGTGTVLEQVGT